MAVLVVGFGLALAAQIAAPAHAPLYDGVPILDPYRYLDPPEGKPGDPGDFASSPGLDNGASRPFAASTPEQPPQAQLIAPAKAFMPPPGATSMNVTIEPVEPAAQPATGSIAGNVYRFAVTDDHGGLFTVAPGQPPTITLRGPDASGDGVIGHYGTNGWEALETSHGGGLGLFQIVATELGDYAVLSGVSAPSDVGRLLAILLTLGVPIVVAGIYLVRRAQRDRRVAAEAADAARARARIPSKRRRRR